VIPKLRRVWLLAALGFGVVVTAISHLPSTSAPAPQRAVAPHRLLCLEGGDLARRHTRAGRPPGSCTACPMLRISCSIASTKSTLIARSITARTIVSSPSCRAIQ